MTDETLIDSEIKELGEKLIEPFEPKSIKGASYDVRVGEIVQLPSQEGENQPRTVALGPKFQPSVSIPPGSTCVIRSFEKIHIPQSMKGRLALRAYHSKKLIFFPGGIIDPGYSDYLFFPIANLGDTPVELKYGEALITAEFVKLNKEAGPYHPSEESPSRGVTTQTLFDRVKLSQEVKKHGEIIDKIQKRLDNSEIQMAASQIILNLIVLAAVAAGSITAVTNLMPTITSPWNAVSLVIGAALGIIALIAIIKVLFRPKRQ